MVIAKGAMGRTLPTAAPFRHFGIEAYLAFMRQYNEWRKKLDRELREKGDRSKFAGSLRMDVEMRPFM